MIQGGRSSRCGFVAILGAPNVGKSTLVNRLVGTKVSIVTHKVQTTRTRVLGISIVGASQIVFVDTPGIFAPRRRLDRAMVAAAWGGAADADLVAVLVDSAKGIDGDTARILERLESRKRDAVLVLNKIDRVKKPALLALAAEVEETETFMISALNGDGVDDMKTYFASAVSEGPWLFPEDQISDTPLRLMAAEVTREKVFLELRQELPYAATVETERWQEGGDGSVRIEQVIYIERDSQKGIVLGKGGQRVKAIGAESRRELEELLERRVHLFLFVKVRERWGDDPERYREWGLDFDA
ncbi:MAG: GTPase Era [Rhodospirillales bacterium]|jgi:GTP-binding protein Era|nr:GTPase Era [Rhodospirillales bacterium]